MKNPGIRRYRYDISARNIFHLYPRVIFVERFLACFQLRSGFSASKKRHAIVLIMFYYAAYDGQPPQCRYYDHSRYSFSDNKTIISYNEFQEHSLPRLQLHASLYLLLSSVCTYIARIHVIQQDPVSTAEIYPFRF